MSGLSNEHAMARPRREAAWVSRSIVRNVPGASALRERVAHAGFRRASLGSTVEEWMSRLTSQRNRVQLGAIRLSRGPAHDRARFSSSRRGGLLRWFGAITIAIVDAWLICSLRVSDVVSSDRTFPSTPRETRLKSMSGECPQVAATPLREAPASHHLPPVCARTTRHGLWDGTTDARCRPRRHSRVIGASRDWLARPPVPKRADPQQPAEASPPMICHGPRVMARKRESSPVRQAYQPLTTLELPESV